MPRRWWPRRCGRSSTAARTPRPRSTCSWSIPGSTSSSIGWRFSRITRSGCGSCGTRWGPSSTTTSPASPSAPPTPTLIVDMASYLVGRAFQTVLSMLVVVSIVFVLTRLSGNPIYLLLDVNATQRDQEILTRHLGLDKPLPVQYGIYVMNVAVGDFGNSIISRRPVTEHIWERLPATVELGFVAMFLSVLIGVPLGMYSAVRRGGVLHLVLPAFTLGYFTSAAILRLTRSAMLEVLGSDYIKFARLKGLREQVVLSKHGLKNALLPVVTFAVMLFVQFLGGAAVTETVFAWPGLGRLILESITTRDYPIVQAGVLVLSALYLTGNLFVDVLYSYLNPRIRRAGA